MDNGYLVLDYGFYEILLYWLYIAQLGICPLITVIEIVVSIGIGVYDCAPVVVSTLLIQIPYCSLLYFFYILLLTPLAHLPVPWLCRQTLLYYA